MSEDLILDRYRPISIAGEGGSGTVQICWDTRIQRRVAIKRIPLIQTDERAGAPVPGLAEARTGAMLSHPSIVSVIDFEVTDNEALLIMEAIEGPTVAQLIANDEEHMLSLDVIAAITDAVGDALDFAHENQVLHLDIKPENILIDMNGHVKVSDFGISELADIQGFGQASGGTIGYMPPEQMEGTDLDQRCDEFAFALVVYEMLTGRAPFVASSLETSERLMDRFDVAAPSSLRTDISPEIDDVLFSAFDPNREERFETILDFLDAIMPLLGNVKQGTAELKQLARATQDMDEDYNGAPDASVWDRIPQRAVTVLGRAVCACICMWISVVGLTAFGVLSIEIALALGLIPAALAAIWPPVGGLVALVVLSAGMVAAPGVAPALGIALIACAIAWFAATVHTSTANVNCMLSAAPLGLAFLTPLTPLISGFVLPPVKAIVATAMSCVLVVTLGIATQGSPPLLHVNTFMPMSAPEGGTDPNMLAANILGQPNLWILSLGYVLSAFSMSLLCSRRTRVLSILGVLCAAAIMCLAVMGPMRLQMGAWVAPGAQWTGSLLASLAIMLVICALGAPYRKVD